MNIFVAGIGPSEYELITLSALECAKRSDIIIVPRSEMNTAGMSERIIMHHVKDKKILALHFPMKKEEAECVKEIEEQLMRYEWEDINNILFPVIGDSVLYSTADYFIRAFRNILPEVRVEFIPGISAHSLAASYAKRFLAMRDEIFSVVSGTSDPERILASMRASDVIAIYKPRAVKYLKELVMRAGDFGKIIRVDYAGIPEKERIYEGIDSLEDIRDYMSIVILWKR